MPEPDTSAHSSRNFDGLRDSVRNILGRSSSLTEAAPKLIGAVCDRMGWTYGELWLVDKVTGTLKPKEFVTLVPSRDLDLFVGGSRNLEFATEVGLPGRVLKARKPIWIPDLATDRNFLRVLLAGLASLRSALAIPVLGDGGNTGAMLFFARETANPDPAALRAFGEIADDLANATGQWVRHGR